MTVIARVGAIVVALLASWFARDPTLAAFHPQPDRTATVVAQNSDPRAIIDEAAAACARVSTIEYEETQARTDERGAVVLRAVVRQQRAAVRTLGFLPGRFRVEGNRDPGSAMVSVACSYDGDVLRVLDAQTKRVQVSRTNNPAEAARLLGEAAMAGMPQFSEEQPFKSVLEHAQSFAYEGRRTVEGTECDVVLVNQARTDPVRGPVSIATRWYIGVADHLPRGNVIGTLEKRLRIRAMNPAAPAAAFAIQVPPGYAEVAAGPAGADVEGLLSAGTPAPDWTLLDADGRAQKLIDYRGHVVLIDFWGTWCVPCVKSMPTIQALHERFGGSGLKVFGVAVGDNEGDPKGFMKRQGYTYTLLLDGDRVAAAYKAKILPTMYVIGTDGRILHAERGYRETAKEDLQKLIEKLVLR